MSRLDRIRRPFPNAAKVLEEVGFSCDSDITSLGKTDLHELFPGVENINIRHALFDIIHQEQSAGITSKVRPGGAETFKRILEKIEEVTPEAFRVFKETVCLDDLERLDRMDLLELLPGVEKLKLRKQIFEIIHPQNSAVVSQPPESGKLKNMISSIDYISNSVSGLTNTKEVRYQKLGSEKSPTVSHQVIRKVTSKKGVNFKDTPGDHKVSILLCPVISRIGSDAEAAIATIEDGKPVILVFLIHSLKPQLLSVLKNWDDSKNIVLHTYIFHHETKSGLLRCKDNDNAISAITKKLLDYSQEVESAQGGMAPARVVTD